MKHLSRWHSVTAGTATAALAAGALGISSILTGAGDPPEPIELSASDSTDDAAPRVEVQQDERVTPTPDVSDSPASPSPASASPASASADSPSADSPSPASVSADSPSPASVSADSPSPASVSADSPSPESIDSPDDEVRSSAASAAPAVVQDSPDSPASVSAESVSASTSVDSAS